MITSSSHTIVLVLDRYNKNKREHSVTTHLLCSQQTQEQVQAYINDVQNILSLYARPRIPTEDTSAFRAEISSAISEITLRHHRWTELMDLSQKFPPMRITSATSVRKFLERQRSRKLSATNIVERSLPKPHLDPQTGLPIPQSVFTIEEYLSYLNAPLRLLYLLRHVLHDVPSSIIIPVSSKGIPTLITAWDQEVLHNFFCYKSLSKLNYFYRPAEYSRDRYVMQIHDPLYLKRLITWNESTSPNIKPRNRKVFTEEFLHEYLDSSPLTITKLSSPSNVPPTLLDPKLFIEHVLINRDSTLLSQAKFLPPEQFDLLRKEATLINSPDRQLLGKRTTLKDYWGQKHAVFLKLFLDLNPIQDSDPFRVRSLKGMDLFNPVPPFDGQLYYTAKYIPDPSLFPKRYKASKPQYRRPLDRILGNRNW